MPNLIAFVGLTHLGLVSAAAALAKGFSVLCFDSDSSLVENLKIANYPINEPDFSETLRKYSDKITFSSILDDLKQASLVYIAPDIPTDTQGTSDLSGIEKLLAEVTPFLSQKACLVILSQVPPGFTRTFSQQKVATGLNPDNIYYQVETLIFGTALKRALYPERFIVGAATVEKPLNPLFEDFLRTFDCPLLVMNYESAEFCKICINAFLAATVATTNTLEEICQKIGARWRDIVPALRLDKRIGEYAYLTPGLGLAGGNIERDLKTITSLAKRHGTHGTSVEAFVKNSRHRKNWPLHTFYQYVLPQLKGKEPIISVLGLAYKENTHSVKNSPALYLLSQLKGLPIQVYDPLVKKVPDCYLEGLIFKDTASEAIKETNVLFLMTPWDEFKSLSPHDLCSSTQHRFIIDPYKILNLQIDVATMHNISYYSLC